MPPLRALVVLLAVAAVAFAVWMLSRSSDIAPSLDRPAPTAGRDPENGVPAGARLAPADTGAPTEREAAPPAEPVSANAVAGAVVLVGRVVDERGGSVANAKVRCADSGGFFARNATRRNPNAAPRPAPAETTTDATGAFQIAAAVAGERAFLRVNARGYRVLEQTVQPSVAGPTDLGTLTLRTGAVVSGRVLDGAGAPIANAKVSREGLRPRPGEFGAQPGAPDFGDVDFDFAEFGEIDQADAPMAEMPADGDFAPPAFLGDLLAGSAATDAEGRFELAYCEPGPFSLRARHAEHPTARLEGLSVAAGATLTDVVVTMAPGATIRGVVVGAPDAATRLRVLASPVRNREAAAPIETPFGDFGADMGDMMADFGGLAERSATVAADRSFAVRGLRPGRPYRVWLAQRGAEFAPSTVCSVKVEVQPPTERLEIRFDPGITVKFQVVDGKRSPIERLWIGDRLRGGGGMEDLMGMVPRQRGSATYPDGRVTLAALRPKKKQTLSLTIDATGFATFERKDIVLPVEGTLDLGTIQLDSTPVVEVAVASADSRQPVANATVRTVETDRAAERDENPFQRMAAGRGSQGPRSGRTDAGGKCVVNVAAGGSFVVEVQSQDFAPYTSAPLAAAPGLVHEVALLRGGTVEAFVAGAGKTPLRIQHSSPRGTRSSESTDADGKAVFAHLEPGQHRFRLADRSGGFDFAEMAGELRGERVPTDEPGWQVVDVVDGATIRVDFTRDPGASLRGIVRENGAPLADARVSFVPGAATDAGAMSADNLGAMMADLGGMGGGRSARAGSDGAYELKNLVAGRHRLRVTAKGRAMPAVVEVTLAPGENVFDVALEVATVRGKVLDPSGQPVAGASVTVVAVAPEKSGADPMAEALEQVAPGVDVAAFTSNTRSAKTADDGSYELRGVQPGARLQVRASGKPFAPGLSEPFTVAKNGARDGVDVKLFAAGKVKVTATESVPFLSAQARLLAADGTVEKAVPPVVQLLSNGAGTLSGLRAGRWRIDLVRPGTRKADSREVDVVAGETAVVAF